MFFINLVGFVHFLFLLNSMNEMAMPLLEKNITKRTIIINGFWKNIKDNKFRENFIKTKEDTKVIIPMLMNPIQSNNTAEAPKFKFL